jgi:shikimate 5-dehydrogenase
MKPEDIKRETTLYGILGDALEKGKLPSHINDFFDANEMDSFCSIFNIREEDMGFFLHGLKQQNNIKGLFVEPSHSLEAIERLDERSVIAEACSVIDSIEIRDGKLIGTFSMAEGLAKTLYAKAALTDKKIALIGANSYAKAVLMALCSFNPKEIMLCDVFLEDALKLSEEIKSLTAYGRFDFARVASDVNIDMSDVTAVINLSSSGSKADDAFISMSKLAPETILVDMAKVESENEPYLISYAKKNGHSYMDGYYLKLLSVSENIYYWQEKSTKIPEDYLQIKIEQKI